MTRSGAPVSAGERRAATELALAAAARIAAPAEIERAFELRRSTKSESWRDGWIPESLATGYLGAALLHAGAAEAPGGSPSAAALQGLLAAILPIPVRRAGLWGGRAGLRFVLDLLRAEGSASDWEQMRPAVLGQADAVAAEGPLRADDFDLVSGLAGIIIAYRDRIDDADCARILAAVERRFLADRAAWETNLGFVDVALNNVSMSHGLAGLIAAVSGLRPSAQRDRVLRGLAGTACSLTFEDPFDRRTRIWGAGFAHGRAIDSRQVWCYGTPGVAAAVLRAARQLNDENLAAFARSALLAVIRRPAESLNADGFTLCHGWAGIGLVAMLFAPDSDELSHRADRIFCDVVAPQLRCALDDDARTGPHELGLLEGLSGAALALLTWSGAVTPRWTAVLGL